MHLLIGSHIVPLLLGKLTHRAERTSSWLLGMPIAGFVRLADGLSGASLSSLLTRGLSCLDGFRPVTLRILEMCAVYEFRAPWLQPIRQIRLSYTRLERRF